MKNLLSLAILTGIFCSTVAHAEPVLQAPVSGTLRVTVLDADGNVVPEAPVYIFGTNKSRFVGGADVPGSSTFSMKEGTYRISSALIKRGADYVDRFSSNEAQVNLVAGDNINIILTLRPVETPADQMPRSYAELHVAGIPSGLISSNN